MGMRKTLEVLNQMLEEGIIVNYAIGGAMGAMYYTEAMTTLDLDVFIALEDEDRLDALSPVYRYLRRLGYMPDPEYGECINIEGVPVQFLTCYDVLVKEALDSALPVEYDGIATKVFTAPYLAAICVKVGRDKDKLRIQMLRKADGFDEAEFQRILEKHHLEIGT